MRRPRVLRSAASSASSLCVFCACRLGAIDLAAVSSTTRTPFQPRPSNPPRRGITTTRAPFQAAATPTESIDNASHSLPPWYDPTSSLSMSEQKEKADRIAARQKYEAEQNQATQERLWKEAEASRQINEQRTGARRKGDEHGKGSLIAHRKLVLEAPSSTGEGGPVTGTSLSQAMLPPRGQPRQNRRRAKAAQEAAPASKQDRDAPSQTPGSQLKIKRILQSEGEAASPVDFKRLALNAAAEHDTTTTPPVRQMNVRNVSDGKRGSTSANKTAQTKVSNPFGPDTADKQDSAAATSGWGKGATHLAPLQYAEVARLPASKKVDEDGETQPKENIPDGSRLTLRRDGAERSFRPQYSGSDSVGGDAAEKQQHDQLQRTEPPHVDLQEDLQAQQSVYEQAAKMFRLQAAEKDEADAKEEESRGTNVSKGTSGRSVQEATVGEHSEEEAPQQPQTSNAVAEAYDHHDFLEHATHLDSAGSAAPESNTSQAVMSDNSEATETVANAGSFGYFGEMAEAEAAPQSHSQGVAGAEQSRQETEQPSSRHIESELGGSSFGSFGASEASAPANDDAPPQPQIRPAGTSPLARMADQTRRSQDVSTRQREAAVDGKPSTSRMAQKATPPPPSVPPPTIAPPPVPPPAASAGGQLAWQPIEGHPQGGQWIWQSSPAAPPAAPEQMPQRNTWAEYSSTGLGSVPPMRTPDSPRVSLGDSGYRVTPFKADEYQTGSSFDEEKAAGWQHLRRKAPESAAPAPAAAPTTAPNLQSQNSKPQVDFDDETWVDRTFDNHLRERQERLRAQREQKRLARQQHSPPSDVPRRLHNEPRQENRKCARCGEVGHIARFCPNPSNPFARPNSGARTSEVGSERPRDRGDDRSLGSGRQMPFERRETGRPSRFETTRNPFASREDVGEQKPRKAWGADQVIFTEPVDMPKREPKADLIRRFMPTQDLSEGNASRDESRKFTPVGGSRAEGRHDTRGAVADRDTESTTARRSGRFEVDAEVDEEAQAPETRVSREKAARKSRWADAEEDVEERGSAASRNVKRAGRREYDEEEDDEAEAREKFRARKAARQAEKEAKENKRLKEARKEREVKKAEGSTPISIPEFVSVQQLSQMLGVRYEQFIGRLEELGYDDVFPGMTLNAETSGMIAMEYNFDPNIDTGAREEEERDIKPRPEVEDKEFLPVRPPVVTIMGHVDHGKTTILDYLRKSSVAAGEAGGITQHIGAFSVPMASSGKTITFLDTPGHAAFLAMRQRGANVTDIVILVVAADDSVKPQTLEAIKHAKAAGVPMIVAINKVDKPEADVERVKQDLARHGVELEDFGGETQVVPVSGKTGKGMDELEETVVALSEILDHRAETDGGVEGWVLEATTKERGRVATVLVRRGTLKPGAVIVAGKTWARVRTLQNEGGRNLKEVGPGMPIEVDGWRDQPVAGDEVLQAPNEQKATSVVEFRQERDEREKAAADMEAINEARRTAAERQQREREAAKALKQAQRTANTEGGTADIATPAKPDDLDSPQQDKSGQIDIPFIIKADVSGSVEAVSAYILSVSTPLITPSILHAQVGPVHESDIELAHAAGGHIIAFNLPPAPQMQGLAESQGVKILENNIIYRVLDDVKEVLEERLPPVVTQRVIGEAEVGAAFEIGVGGRKKVKIAGCKVRNGSIGKGARVRVMRGSATVYDGTITSLKNVKKDVPEMRKGTECGMGFQNWEGFEVGDQVQTYEEVSERRKL